MNTGLQNRINKSISQAYKGNLIADALMHLVNDCLDHPPDQKIIHQFLDLAHIQSVAKTISKAKVTEEWLERIVRLIHLSQYHTGTMIEQRAKRYGDKTVFNMIHGNDLHTMSY